MLAYFDTLTCGLVPVRILRLRSHPGYGLAKTDLLFDCQVTAERGAYRRGQIVTGLSDNQVVPRAAVYRSRQRCGQSMIRSYDWARVIFTGTDR